MNGSRWCSHSDCTGIALTTTSSSYFSSLGKVVRLNWRGVSISAYARAIRAGLSRRPGLSVETPSASRKSCAARVAASIPASASMRGSPL